MTRPGRGRLARGDRVLHQADVTYKAVRAYVSPRRKTRSRTRHFSLTNADEQAGLPEGMRGRLPKRHQGRTYPSYDPRSRFAPRPDEVDNPAG